MDLLYALDDRFQDGVVEPAAIAPSPGCSASAPSSTAATPPTSATDGPRPQDVWAVYQAGHPASGRP